jgi:hypothetical protein
MVFRDIIFELIDKENSATFAIQSSDATRKQYPLISNSNQLYYTDNSLSITYKVVNKAYHSCLSLSGHILLSATR